MSSSPLFARVFPCRCAGCGVSGEVLCPSCRPHPRPGGELRQLVGLCETRAAVPYVGGAAHLVLAVKRTGMHAGIALMAESMMPLLTNLGEIHGEGLVMTWAPTSRDRRMQRGFDHAELLTRRLARDSGLPFRRLLDRRSSAQHGRSAEERQAVVFAPTGAVRSLPVDIAVVIVDDVCTTGGTLRSASYALVNARPNRDKKIIGLTYATAGSNS
jgi:predicted amidophosphoribosyltransferase